jgi:hypothetical protein
LSSFKSQNLTRFSVKLCLLLHWKFLEKNKHVIRLQKCFPKLPAGSHPWARPRITGTWCQPRPITTQGGCRAGALMWNLPCIVWWSFANSFKNKANHQGFRPISLEATFLAPARSTCPGKLSGMGFTARGSCVSCRGMGDWLCLGAPHHKATHCFWLWADKDVEDSKTLQVILSPQLCLKPLQTHCHQNR